MSRSIPAILLALVAACRGVDLGSEPSSLSGASPDTTDTTDAAGDSGTTDDSGITADPHVDTWVPPDWPVDGPARIVFLGDSISTGVGATTDARDYVSLLLSNDNALYPAYEGWDLSTLYGDIPAYDASMNGATTDTVFDVQLPAIMEAIGEQPEGPTLVIGTIAGNDVQEVVFGFAQLADERDRIAANVDGIAQFFLDEERFPDGAMVFLTNVYEPTDGLGQADACFFGLDLSGVLEDFDIMNQQTRELAQQSGWAWVDLHGHFLGHGHNHDDAEGPNHEADDPTLWLQRDCIHPNNRGHHEIRRLFLSAIDNRPLPE